MRWYPRCRLNWKYCFHCRIYVCSMALTNTSMAAWTRPLMSQKLKTTKALMYANWRKPWIHQDQSNLKYYIAKRWKQDRNENWRSENRAGSLFPTTRNNDATSILVYKWVQAYSKSQHKTFRVRINDDLQNRFESLLRTHFEQQWSGAPCWWMIRRTERLKDDRRMYWWWEWEERVPPLNKTY